MRTTYKDLFGVDPKTGIFIAEDGRRAYYLSSKAVFLQHPRDACVWIRTSWAPAIVSCSTCGRPAGLPCRGRHLEFTGSHHAERQAAFNDYIEELLKEQRERAQRRKKR